jgi:hypothetical protein
VRGQWKPGDVAMVTCRDGKEREATFCTHVATEQVSFWKFRDGSLRDADISDARPLVVIDPENLDQVAALLGGYCGWKGAEDVKRNGDTYVGEMQAALRSLLPNRGDLLTHYPAGVRNGVTTALCGKVWTPKSNPDGYDRCPECLDLVGSTWVA